MAESATARRGHLSAYGTRRFRQGLRVEGPDPACSRFSMSNIAEGFERGGPAEFHQFLVIAKASCAELRAQLYLALDIGHIDQTVFDETGG